MTSCAKGRFANHFSPRTTALTSVPDPVATPSTQMITKVFAALGSATPSHLPIADWDRFGVRSADLVE